MFVEVRELVVDGSPAAYRVAGEGEPVVLVHGLSGSWRWWRPVLEPLTERRRVYVPELPRLGRRVDRGRAGGRAAAPCASARARRPGRYSVRDVPVESQRAVGRDALRPE